MWQEWVILKEDQEHGDEAYVVMTPDSRLWRLRLSRPHVEGFRILAEDRAIPPGIHESDCYTVNEATHDGLFSGAQLANLIIAVAELLGEQGPAVASSAAKGALAHPAADR